MKSILVICIMLSSYQLIAQTNTFPSNGNVGVGTITPSEKLEIYGGGNLLIRGSANDAGDLIFRKGDNSQLARIWTNNSGSSGMYLSSGDNTSDITIYQNGNIGIGTNSPAERLEINGKLKLNYGGDSWMIINPSLGVSSLNPGVTTAAASITSRKYGHLVIDIYGNDNKDAFAVRTDSDKNGILDNIPFLVNNYGNVGIGTTSPDYKLDVLGTIRANEVKVATGWSDFVFEPDYDLKSLDQVEEFITENGHLPDIPSAEEVEENGISLGEMDAKLLQKIEELTLYVIEQQKELSELKKENEELKSKDKEIDELKAMVKALMNER